MPLDEFLDSLPLEPVKPLKPSRKKTPRVPPTRYHGINVNFCKKPSCANFGVPVEETAGKGPGAVNRYTIVANGKGLPAARCNACGENFPLKSNDGVFEEAWRICGETFGEPSCPDQSCENHRVPLSTPKAYYAYGTNKSGSPRHRCRICRKIFTVKPAWLDPVARHRDAAKNEDILELLVNKMPLRRICEVKHIAPRVLYERIDFFYEQALVFLCDRESKLPVMSIRRLYVGVDRQEYAINWARRKDKKNVILSAVAAADNVTGYVFGMHTNFDPGVDAQAVEQDVVVTNDDKLSAPHRKYARLWLKADYEASLRESIKQRAYGSLLASIAGSYKESAARPDIESSEFMDGDRTLPDNGMLIHAEYTLHGHFIRLAKLFEGVEKVRFFLDQDSGLRAACFAAFADRIKDGDVDAFYVRITKDQTVDVKRRQVADARKVFDKVAAEHPELEKHEVKLLMLRNEIHAAMQIGQWKDRWVRHPLPTISESEKASCFLTDLGNYDEDHQAWLHNKASLHAVDSWFNRLRRRNMMLERPISSASNKGRTWHGYSTYKPEQIAKILTIMRVCHNYIWLPADLTKADKKETPAMRLGLADKPLNYSDIVNFRGQA